MASRALSNPAHFFSHRGGVSGTLGRWYQDVMRVPKETLQSAQSAVSKVAGHGVGSAVVPGLVGGGLGALAATLPHGLDVGSGKIPLVGSVPIDGVLSLGLLTGGGTLHQTGTVAFGIFSFRKMEEFVRRRRALKHGVLPVHPAHAAVAAHGDPILDAAAGLY